MAAPAWDTTTLELRMRERCDMVNSEFISSEEAQRYLEAAWQEFYGIAVAEIEDSLIATDAILTVAGTQAYGLPSQMRKLKGIRLYNEYFLAPVAFREIETFDYQQNRGKPRAYWRFNNYPATEFASETADLIQVLPTPDAVYTLAVYYVPSVSLEDISSLAATGKAFAYLAGWDEYVVLTAAIKAKDKEESDTSVLFMERAQLLENMRKSWTPIDQSEPPRVVQMRSPYRDAVLHGLDGDEVFS